MDDTLQTRLRLFDESGEADQRAVAFVRAELEQLGRQGLTVTEDTAGMLTSHLVMALTRALSGEALSTFHTDEQVAGELAEHPDAVAAARDLASRARRQLDIDLPHTEINFLAMHLAVLHTHSAPHT